MRKVRVAGRRRKRRDVEMVVDLKGWRVGVSTSIH
jgi:hypothetical protein